MKVKQSAVLTPQYLHEAVEPNIPLQGIQNPVFQLQRHV